jgi:hypothetical protein
MAYGSRVVGTGVAVVVIATLSIEPAANQKHFTAVQDDSSLNSLQFLNIKSVSARASASARRKLTKIYLQTQLFAATNHFLTLSNKLIL